MLYPVISPLAKCSAGFSQETLSECEESGETEGGNMNTGANKTKTTRSIEMSSTEDFRSHHSSFF